MERFDAIVVGAGISGIGCAWRLQTMRPPKRYAILEARDAVGGTWDLFRYPGVRSDSDMHTLGFSFRPWKEAEAIADGPSILRYVNETADEHDIRRHIRFGHRVARARWSTDDATWTVEAEHGARTLRFACDMLLMCGGYYDYENPHRPSWEGEDDFAGVVVLPQFWPEDLDFRGRRVAVIGSGATAMTLVPAMAMAGAAHVTMVQRSPTYVLSWPSRDRFANALGRWLPARLAYAIVRWRNARRDLDFYRRARAEPDKVKAELVGLAREALGPDYDVETHFTPTYGPWDQRLCLLPDADLFHAIGDGKAGVATGEIDRFAADGIRLKTGETVKADVVVAATGLRLAALGGVALVVDGAPVDVSERWTYKGMMLSDVPNMVQTFGYINASWTLRADLTAEWACRLIARLDETGHRQATPRLAEDDAAMRARPWIDDFPAGYMKRGMSRLPRQGDRAPWLNTQDYGRDLELVKYAPVDDDRLEFSNPGPVATDRAA